MSSKTYGDDQRHPSGATGKDVIPDTHDRVDVDQTTRGPGCGVTLYIPGDGFLISHGGFSEESKASVYDKKVRAIRKAQGDTGKRQLPQGGTFLGEEEILSYAATIHAHRRMTGAKGAKERIFEEARARRHAGTDAYDSAKDGMHNQSDDFGIDKSRSTIFIGVSSCGPPGMPLNGSKIYHHNVVSITITNPDGRRICDVMMSLEQFALALVGMSHTPCTLSSYWSISDESTLLTERVRPPVSIRKRMEKRLKHRLQEQTDALLALVKEMREQAESGKPARKTQLRDLAERVERAVEHSASNSAFTIDQAREEVTSIMESAALQFLGHRNLDPKTLWEAAGPALGMSGDGTPLLPDLEGPKK